MSKLTDIQTVLGVMADGVWGPKSKAALEAAISENKPPLPEVLNLPWGVTVDGADLVIENVRCTCFGGSGDSMDSGETASGFSTKDHPDIKAVSLPMRYDGPSSATRKALGESPIPMMPFGLHHDGTENREGAWVRVFHNDNDLGVFPVIDLGPDISRFPKNAMDATIALARLMNPHATANSFEAVVSYRIINGAKYLSA